jgi:hypothetical protein
VERAREAREGGREGGREREEEGAYRCVEEALRAVGDALATRERREGEKNWEKTSEMLGNTRYDDDDDEDGDSEKTGSEMWTC